MEEFLIYGKDNWMKYCLEMWGNIFDIFDYVYDCYLEGMKWVL